MVSAYLSVPENIKFSEIQKLIITGILLCLAFQLYLQFTQQINWDEFKFLSQIYDYQRGRLDKSLQTFHVHLFAWLPALGSMEIEQIVIARILIWGIEVATLILIYSVCSAFVSRTAALFAVLAYISSGFVLIHGTSFRTDPIATCAIMLCLFLLIRSRLAIINLAGVALILAIAALITAKIVFFTVALIGVSVWRMKISPQPLRLAVKLAATAIATIIFFALFYGYHLSTIPLDNMSDAHNRMSSAFTITLLSDGFFPRSEEFIRGLILAPIQSSLLYLGICIVVLDIVRPKAIIQTPNLAMLFVLASPLLSFIFYRNAFPYFFAFIFPSSMVLVGYFFDRIKASRLTASVLSLLMVTTAFLITLERRSANSHVQRETIQMVHRTFSQPVNYIDRCSMISSFPKQGIFMSSWGYMNYAKRAKPIYANILNSETTPLLINNSPLLNNALLESSRLPHASLLDEDVITLRENFIHHWGYLWVAGKALRADKTSKIFRIMTPGIYTVEAENSVEIDGIIYPPEATLNLPRGSHSLTAQTSFNLILRWGDHLSRPDMPASTEPIFQGF